MNMVKAMVGPFFDNRKADIENNVVFITIEQPKLIRNIRV